MATKKIPNDAYYTSAEVAEYCFKKAIEIIGVENIVEFIESSAGQGVFIDMIEKYTPYIPYQAYDIDPKDSRIKKANFLELKEEYKTGRVVGFNFPYGSRNNLSKAFANKGFEIAEYVCSILPISQLNNTQSIYKYDLIYSENLGKRLYSGIEVHCCFNIYKRPISGECNKKISYRESEIIEIREIREVIKNNNPKRNRELGDFEYDIKMLAWGTATNGRDVGCFLQKNENYAKTFYIKIHKQQYKEKIIKLLREVKWQELYPMTATPNLLQWQVYKYVNEKVKESDLVCN